MWPFWKGISTDVHSLNNKADHSPPLPQLTNKPTMTGILYFQSLHDVKNIKLRALHPPELLDFCYHLLGNWLWLSYLMASCPRGRMQWLNTGLVSIKVQLLPTLLTVAVPQCPCCFPTQRLFCVTSISDSPEWVIGFERNKKKLLSGLIGLAEPRASVCEGVAWIHRENLKNASRASAGSQQLHHRSYISSSAEHDRSEKIARTKKCHSFSFVAVISKAKFQSRMWRSCQEPHKLQKCLAFYLIAINHLCLNWINEEQFYFSLQWMKT